jgi:hypothetical protein
MDGLYDKDVAQWASEQARALREHDHTRLDYDNLAEEIESLAKADRRALESHVATVLQHLMKLQASPATDPRRGWQDSVIEARSAIRRLLRDSPSLRGDLPEIVQAETAEARELASRSLSLFGETPRVALDTLRYDEAQVLGDWFPPTVTG